MSDCVNPRHQIDGRHVFVGDANTSPCMKDPTGVPPRLPDDLSELPVLDLKAFIEVGTEGWFTGMWRDFHAAMESLNLPGVGTATYEKIETELDAVRKRIADIFEIPEGLLDLTDEQLHRLLHPHLYDTKAEPADHTPSGPWTCRHCGGRINWASGGTPGTTSWFHLDTSESECRDDA